MDAIAKHAHDELLSACNRFIVQHRRLYLDATRLIEPDRQDWRQVWDRLAFAILTANTEVGHAVNALTALRSCRDSHMMSFVDAKSCRLPGITYGRVEYVKALPCHAGVYDLLRFDKTESWDEYRLRLRKEVRGLAMTKATYAACLLYPREADVACLDVWMQKILGGESTRFRSLSDVEYRLREGIVREVGRRHSISTALAQWAMWDFIRNGVPTSQRFFD